MPSRKCPSCAALVGPSDARCPLCGTNLAVFEPAPPTEDLAQQPAHADTGGQTAHPYRIGRYRIDKLLGEGGFGLVYLAYDEQLDRRVAIKVPHAKLVSQSEDAEAYLAEARAVANLDHPHIVPVYDAGSTEECPCYIVSKYVEGTDLSSKLRERRLLHREAAQLVATVAEALHHAHKQGLVHRDVKPGNILIDGNGKPHIVDFGLALREDDHGKGPKYAGTPVYMSPEQARGEGHRVDGRSDIFSLGVVLYEMLVGRRPFRGDSHTEVLEQVTGYEPRPPRQYDDRIPKELERICHKAMAKKATARYSTAQDFADDLWHFLAEQTAVQSDTSPSGAASASGEKMPLTPTTSSGASPSEERDTSHRSQPIKIVPKGLRSFDAHDADFFLELLPGPRDRHGLPDSLRFWKTRIEETDPDHTFSVGLIYGPSGCGKSSLVQAGLLPRLSDDIISVFVEATPEQTESRLLHGLRKRCPALEERLSLKESLAALRRGQGVAVGQKVLLVLDQFEQWLHAKKEEAEAELVQALRQCDGGRVQCIVMVRDDFWMATTRFMRELEIRLLEGHNVALVDLFDVDHGRKVLAAFGRAFGKLPENTKETSQQQKDFIKQSVAGLADEGKIICVRLALFAEMIKSKPWVPSTLKEVGGTAGVGATFLEETFNSSTASPAHRYHQKAARDVLRALLPESGTDIKGQMKSYHELLAASGYENRRQDFDDLIRLLDGEIRLITPTDPVGVQGEDDAISHATSDQKYYQLTHDYLVHSLREWLTRRQRETRRGRAELRLAERSAIYKAQPENRHLPSAWEYLTIRLLTNKKNWTGPQRTMLSTAKHVHATRLGLVLAVLLIVGVSVQQYGASVRQRILTERMKSAVTSMSAARGILVPRVITDLGEFPRAMVLKEVRQRYDAAEDADKLSLTYALAYYNQVDLAFLVSSIKDATGSECSNLVAAMESESDRALPRLKELADNAQQQQDWVLKGRLAVVAMHLGDSTIAADVNKPDRRDPTQQTVFIHDVFPTWHGDLRRLATRMQDVDDGGLRHGVCLAMGKITDLGDAKQQWHDLLARWFQESPDSGTHGAVGWALRQWGIENSGNITQLADVPDDIRQRVSTVAKEVSQIEHELADARKQLTDRQQVWEAELRSVPPKPHAALQNGLVTHYPLDEESGALRNLVEGAAEGTFRGFHRRSEPGVDGNGLHLNGDGYVDCGTDFQPQHHDSFSYGGWFLTESKAPRAIIAKLDTDLGYRGFDVFINDGTIEAHIKHRWQGNAIKVTAGRALADGNWHHVFVTYDGSQKAAGVTVYVDGHAVESTVVADNLTDTIANSVSLNIGRRSSGDPFIGLIDEVRIYNRELSATEVKEIVSADVESLARMDSDSRTVVQKELVNSFYVFHRAPVFQELVSQLNAARSKVAEATAEGLTVELQSLSTDWFVNRMGMTMVRVPAGSLERPAQQLIRQERTDVRVRQHVTLSEFWLSDREVSVDLFQRFIDDENYEGLKPLDWNGPDARISPAGQHPVSHVSWEDAVLFCNWLSAQVSLTPFFEVQRLANLSSEQTIRVQILAEAAGYRLPTEAEWEYACRAGAATEFHFGHDFDRLSNYAVYRKPSTAVSGSKMCNRLGLFDMHGNIWEWCYDKFGQYDDEPAIDPTGPPSGSGRANRGGAWGANATFCESGVRNWSIPTERGDLLGFRVALSSPGKRANKEQKPAGP